jgi:hypothetical protein
VLWIGRRMGRGTRMWRRRSRVKPLTKLLLLRRPLKPPRVYLDKEKQKEEEKIQYQYREGVLFWGHSCDIDVGVRYGIQAGLGGDD